MSCNRDLVLKLNNVFDYHADHWNMKGIETEIEIATKCNFFTEMAIDRILVKGESSIRNNAEIEEDIVTPRVMLLIEQVIRKLIKNRRWIHAGIFTRYSNGNAR